MGRLQNDPFVKVYHAEEFLKRFDGLRPKKGGDGSDLSWQGNHPFWSDAMPQKVNRCQPELALVGMLIISL